ncbi:MAG: hypothetical protein GEU97_11020 [Actinophytocola sp.]|nr:hypothetical protein [Actinophytocola sp.]
MGVRDRQILGVIKDAGNGVGGVHEMPPKNQGVGFADAVLTPGWTGAITFSLSLMATPLAVVAFARTDTTVSVAMRSYRFSEKTPVPRADVIGCPP